MRLFAFLVFFSFFVVPVAFAQNSAAPVFGEETPRTAEEEIEELLGEQIEDKNPKTIEDYAFINNKQCVKAFHPYIHPDAIDDICSCVSVRMPKEMTLEQIYDINANNEEGRYQFARLMSFVYLPCLKRPVEQYVLSSCNLDNRIQLTIKHPAAYCSCLASRVGEKTQTYAENFLKDIVERGRLEDDPILELIPPDAYKGMYDFENYICVRKFHIRAQ